MIALPILLALAGSPAAEFTCPLESPHRSATLGISQTPSWHINFLNYSGAASQLDEKTKDSTDRIGWQDASGTEFRADVNWSNSWGSTGVAAMVKVTNRDTGETFEGACYPNGERA